MSGGMTAAASVRAARVGDRTVLTELASEPPIALRETADGLMLVNSAGGPLRGDAVSLMVTVERGAALECGSIAATVAQDGPHRGSPSRFDVRAFVGPGASLTWRPQPTVLAAGSDHVMTFTAELDGDARLFATEVVVLGRHGEEPGRVRSRWDVRVDGVELLVQELDLGEGAPPGWRGPAVTAGARVIVMAIAVDPDWDEEACLRAAGPSVAGEVLDLAGGGILLTTLVDSAVAAEREVTAFAERVRLVGQESTAR